MKTKVKQANREASFFFFFCSLLSPPPPAVQPQEIALTSAAQTSMFLSDDGRL